MQIKKEYTCEQIVEVAKKVFLKNGYAKTSMRDIAKGAGIGVSNIYNYFKSNEVKKHTVRCQD
ncbi:MAG: helix-turn-helix transcriptional regulator [Paludibacteraceae bacterium]|nr:helix-turn-helix transcriptional regulator [Paludibacteraceae bacterium]